MNYYYIPGIIHRNKMKRFVIDREPIERSNPSNEKELRKVEKIRDNILDYYSADLHILNSRTRKVPYPDILRKIMFFSRTNTNAGVDGIASILLRDHSCVSHHFKTAKGLLEVDKGYTQEIKKIASKYDLTIW